MTGLFMRFPWLKAEELHNAARAHWGVEVMYCQLDIGFSEDARRIRVDDRAEAFSRNGQACLCGFRAN
ncbi:hypothetical protein BCV02_05055 [Vibrio breoganii]|nr:hypothetical protein BCV02_05055 [Vibrio breoganii]